MKIRYIFCKIFLWLGILFLVLLPIPIIFAIEGTDTIRWDIIALGAFIFGLFCIVTSGEIFFGSYLRFFPLNNFKEFDVSFEKEEDVLEYGDFLDNKGTFAINVKETEEGVWTVLGKEKNLRLDLYSFPRPKEYIVGFFVRNLNYVDYNKTNHAYRTLYKKRKISWLNKITDVKIVFDINGEKIEEYIVKNKQTYLHFFTYRIMHSSLAICGHGIPTFYQEHHEASERIFRDETNRHVFAQEKRPPYWYDPTPDCYPYSDVFDENGNPLYPDNDERLSHPKYAEKTKKKR